MSSRPDSQSPFIFSSFQARVQNIAIIIILLPYSCVKRHFNTEIEALFLCLFISYVKVMRYFKLEENIFLEYKIYLFFNLFTAYN